MAADHVGGAGLRLRDLGEQGLLARLFPRLPTGTHTVLGPGDDAALVRAPDGRVVVTTDVLVAGRDFRFDWSSPQDVGVKAAAQNLADVAAMGAVPTALLVALVAPPDLPVDWALGLAEGLEVGCRGTGAGVVGGDLSSGVELMVAVTALGDLQGRPPVRRDAASPGQVVAVAGPLGSSAAGLALLQAGALSADPEVTALVAAHRRPSPPYACGPLAARGGATAMLDLSDGLVRDAARVALASSVRIDLDPALLRRDADRLAAVASRLGADPWEWVLAGGEDHGLLAVFPDASRIPEPFRPVGRTRAPGDDAGGLVDDDNDLVLLAGAPWAGPVGWDHFRQAADE
ncbi:MAG: thiamine-phosphate kinase [Actinomycetes bacterium]